jgi:hypothetical protein
MMWERSGRVTEKDMTKHPEEEFVERINHTWSSHTMECYLVL